MDATGWGFDASYLLWVLPGMLLAMFASIYVRITFSRWSKVALSGGRSGAEIAAELLSSAGISDVHIEPASGFLSDHYDPSAHVLRLSPDVYEGRTVAAAGVAAHEAGHAIQHKLGYLPMQIRQRLILPARLGSQLSYFVILAGLVLQVTGLAWFGVALFAAVFAFEVITVPVEVNASDRAAEHLTRLGLVTAQEAVGVRKVLRAAALTYIAAMLTSALTLLYYIRLVGRRDD